MNHIQVTATTHYVCMIFNIILIPVTNPIINLDSKSLNIKLPVFFKKFFIFYPCDYNESLVMPISCIRRLWKIHFNFLK